MVSKRCECSSWVTHGRAVGTIQGARLEASGLSWCRFMYYLLSPIVGNDMHSLPCYPIVGKSEGHLI